MYNIFTCIYRFMVINLSWTQQHSALPLQTCAPPNRATSPMGGSSWPEKSVWCNPWCLLAAICLSHGRMGIVTLKPSACEAMVMCGNNHWIIPPNLTRSIQIDLCQGDRGPIYGNQWSPPQSSNKQRWKSHRQLLRPCCNNPHPAVERTVMLTTASLYLLLLKPQVFYLGLIQKQPVIQQLPSVRHTDEAQQGRNSCLWLLHLCLLDDWEGDHWLP